MEIKIGIPSRGKTATLEVEKAHDANSVVEVLCKELELGDRSRWSLTRDGKTMSNSETLGQLSVHDGDRIELVMAQTEDTITKPENQVKEAEPVFAAEHKCSCGKRLTWISQYERFYCYRCKKYPPTCSICKKDLFWVAEYSRYYCNACGSYAPRTSLAL